MKFQALKECPQGQQPGEIFDATEDAGHVLELVGAAKRVDDEPTDIQTSEPLAEQPVSEPPQPRRRYRRNDLTAQD